MKPTPDLRDLVLAELRSIVDPCSVGSGNQMNIVEMGLVKSVQVQVDSVRIDMCLTSPTCMMLEHFVAEGTRLVGALPGVSNVEVHGDTGLEWTSERIAPDALLRRQRHLDSLDERHRSAVDG